MIIFLGRTYGAPYRVYGYVPLRYGENVVRRMGTKHHNNNDNFSCISSKPYVVDLHLNRLIETVEMRGRNICFMHNKQKLSLIVIKILPLI